MAKRRRKKGRLFKRTPTKVILREIRKHQQPGDDLVKALSRRLAQTWTVHEIIDDMLRVVVAVEKLKWKRK